MVIIKMKIETFEQYFKEDSEQFDNRVNDFIKDKQVIQITTNETASNDYDLTHSLTVLYKEG